VPPELDPAPPDPPKLPAPLDVAPSPERNPPSPPLLPRSESVNPSGELFPQLNAAAKAATETTAAIAREMRCMMPLSRRMVVARWSTGSSGLTTLLAYHKPDNNARAR
jgi:hypothetical protein